jgi:dihydroorotase
MNASGCRVFSDGIKGIQNSGLLLRALRYTKSFNGLIINAPIKQSLTNNGHLHEGITSTLNGTSGIPSMAEFTAVNEQLAIAEYAESNICFYGISTKEGVKAIKSFKSKSVEIKSIVPYLNLIFTDEDLASFDTNLKVLPPLREKDDQKELIKGLTEGVITAISSNHAPFDAESKDLEFHYAKFGASGIETVFAALNTFCKKLPIGILIKALTEGPRSILELENPIIQEGDKANLTIFDLDKEWVFDQTESSSLNNPFLGKTLIGKVIKTINS